MKFLPDIEEIKNSLKYVTIPSISIATIIIFDTYLFMLFLFYKSVGESGVFRFL